MGGGRRRIRIIRLNKIPLEGAKSMKSTIMVGLNAKAIVLVQKRPVEEASNMKETFAPS